MFLIKEQQTIQRPRNVDRHVSSHTYIAASRTKHSQLIAKASDDSSNLPKHAKVKRREHFVKQCNIADSVLKYMRLDIASRVPYRGQVNDTTKHRRIAVSIYKSLVLLRLFYDPNVALRCN